MRPNILFVATIPLISALPQQTKPPPEYPPFPKINSFKFTGVGCDREGSVVTSLSWRNSTDNNGQLYTYIDTLTPYAGPQTRPTDRNKKCNVSIEFEADKEWKIRVNTKGTRAVGYAILNTEKTTLTYSGTYNWVGSEDIRSRGQFTLYGPREAVFHSYAPVVTPPVVGFPGPGVDSRCGGGTLLVQHRASIGGDTTSYGGWEGDPTEDELRWGFMTDIELWKC